MPSTTSFSRSSQGDVGNRDTVENPLLPPLDSTFDGDFSKIRNPFKAPKDVEWVEMCQEEKMRSLQQKRDERLLRVDQKQTYRSRVVNATLPTVRKFFRELDEEFEKEAKELDNDISKKILSGSGMVRIRPLEKESNFVFKSRKREMFLVKYTLKAKLDEISSYKVREAEETKKIEIQAERLRKEAILFDEFLKATDKDAAEAMKTAEKEAKMKLEKTIELRRLQGALGVLRADVTRKDELLCEYFSYKSFVMMFHHNINKASGSDLSFEMWEKHRGTRNKKKKKSNKKRPVPTRTLRRRSQANLRRSSEITDGSLLRKTSKIGSLSGKNSGHQVENQQQPERVLPSKQNYPEEWEEDEDHASNMQAIEYILEDPNYVIDAVHEKEEESLRLIYRLQSLQDALDEQKRYRSEKMAKKGKELDRLVELVDIMQSNIDNINTKCDELKLKCKLLGADEQATVDEQLHSLTGKVEKVYRGVFGRVLVRLDGLAMLSCVEKRLDQLLDEVETLPDENVRMLQKVRDKQRRLALREDKILQQKLKQEERLRKALERANKMSQRNFGRKLMFRSVPPKFKIASAKKHDASSDTESVYFFSA